MRGRTGNWDEPDHSDPWDRLVADWSERGLALQHQVHPDGSADFETIDLPEEERGQGLGSRFVRDAKRVSDQQGLPHRWVKVTNPAFFNRFPHLTPERDMRSPAHWTYSYDPRRVSSTERVIPNQHHPQPCPTCGDPMQGGTCLRCNWPGEPNLDSDPLSNPPDPTKDLHRAIQSQRLATNRSLYHGTIIDHLPSIQQWGLIPDVGEFTSDAYSLDENGEYDQGDERPYTQKELGIVPAVYMADKRDLGKAQTAMTAAVAKKLDKTYHEVTPQDIHQHGLLVKLPGGEAGFSAGETGLNYAEGDDYYGERPYTVEPGDWWSEDGVGGDLQYITGPAISRVFDRYLNPSPPRPQGWSAEQGQIFPTQPYYQKPSYSRVVPSHRWAKWFDAVDDLS